MKDRPEEIKLAGVVGFPVAHSKSPAMHRYWLDKYNVKGDYMPLSVQPDDLKQVFEALPKMGFKGVNITIPHKVDILSCVDMIEDSARKAGAANLVVFRDGGSIAKNTDGFGFLENLTNLKPDINLEFQTGVILGTGGAARGVLSALIDENIGRIKLVYRNREAAESLASLFGKSVEIFHWDSRSDILDDADILINATPLGMVNQESLDISLDGLQKSALVYDLVYNPLHTPLLKQASSRGFLIADGLGMLIHQARPAFNDWFGFMPEATQELRKLMEQGL